MSKRINAFPATGEYSYQQGMTLRDYFAAKALQGELACQSDDSTWTDFGILARRCYDIADSMLKVREQTNENNHN